MPSTNTQQARDSSPRSIILGTAGHIDHGKSSLVQALTGKNPDRLPEEKKRGITIDLGFADLDLGETRVGFVDVPGHERFVKNMLAGVHGIDVVALVIAADEGVMPQTREHFDICRLLDVRQGLVVITKTDLVEEELLDLVQAEVAELVQGSFLEGAPVVLVSAKTGVGLAELRATLREVAGNVADRPSDFVARLPIDRVFTMKGFGAVVTGTLVSGSIAEGDELQILPHGKKVRVRGVQVHGAGLSRAVAGQRTAVNLGGVDVAEIERGMMLAQTSRLRPTQVIDTYVSILPSAPRALRTRSRVRVHIGSAEILARVKVLNAAGEIQPGRSDFAQLRLESPVVAVIDDRLIIRSYSPSTTIGGAVVLDPFATKHRGRELEATSVRLSNLMKEDRSNRIVTFVESAGDGGMRNSDLAARTGWNDSILLQTAQEAVQGGKVVDADGVFIAKDIFERFKTQTLASINQHHQREPLSRGVPRETLRERHFSHTPPEVFRAVVANLELAHEVVSDNEIVRSAKHSLELSGSDAELRKKISAEYENAGLNAPTFDQVLVAASVPASQKAHARKILQLLINDGTLVRVEGEMFFHAGALTHLKTKLQDYGTQHEPDRLIDVPKFKELARISRKYAIPLLEYFDRERVTRRAGDKRLILK